MKISKKNNGAIWHQWLHAPGSNVKDQIHLNAITMFIDLFHRISALKL
jgi:hypothetical protein